MLTSPTLLRHCFIRTHVGACLVFLQREKGGRGCAIVRTYLGVDVLLRFSLLDLEQRWARDVHVALLDERSLLGEINTTATAVTPAPSSQRHLSHLQPGVKMSQARASNNNRSFQRTQ